MENSASVGVAAGGLVLAVLTTIAPLRAWRRSQRAARKSNGYSPVTTFPYEDEDGVATVESLAAFKDRIPKYVIYLATTAGFAVSIAAAVWGTIEPEKALRSEGWLLVPTWVCLFLHVLGLAREPSSSRRFRLGAYIAVAAVVLAIVLVAENLLRFYNVPARPYVVHLTLSAVQLAMALSVMIGGLSLPRRPNVFHKEKVVDAMCTVSALDKMGFAWCTTLLDFALKKGSLDLQDLPTLDHLRRSHSLLDSFQSLKRAGRLWKLMILAHLPNFIKQWGLCLVTGILDFMPQVAMYQILRLLELRQVGVPVALQAWLWVLVLGLGKGLVAYTESWMFWLGWGALGVPVKAQLSALVFAKAMRRKDIKGVEDTKVEDNGVDQIAAGESDSGKQKSRQSQVNLVAVDASRVCDFAVTNAFYPITVVQLVVSILFLLKLIQWPSLLAGLATLVIFTPLNAYFAKKYTDSQDRLMKVRDVKMGVVTEALQGIRQIKFSALERQWQKKIGDVRSRELKELWSVFRNDTALLFTWIASPVMLAAVSLAVYVKLNGVLTPSVAFTAISVFSQLEVTLSVIPELTTMGIDAWVSISRIAEYLESPEKEVRTTPSDSIAFKNAHVAWPSEEETIPPDVFTLRNLNIEFPNHELSVISGKTGSGKSLLLASLMSEAEIISGSIHVPRPPSSHERYDHKAYKESWIIPSSIAYVAQIPWIQNATLKDNILYGLPCDDERYRKVMHACALKKDLEMLSDGDQTEIGANGINLSGGQRWRVSFARALYSRAGILILDDIFSAVDTHVGRHLLEKALVGELGRGRTRILVTHHVGLCLPHANFTVFLDNGEVEHAGFVEELKRSGSLADILTREEEDLGAASRNEASKPLELIDSATIPDTEVEERVEEHETPLKEPKKPRKFVEDEYREHGKIKWDIYKTYLVSTGGTWFCIVAVLLFGSYEVIILGRSWWIRLWTKSYQTKSTLFSSFAVNQHIMDSPEYYHMTSADQQEKLGYYLGIYVGVSIGICIVGTLRYLWIFFGSIRVSRRLFDSLSYAVLRAPLRWLDTVPMGRILNRFTADFNILDSRMGYDISFFIHNVLQLVGIFVAGIFVSPFMILIALFIFGICLFYARRYIVGAREVKRIESNTKSPILEVFSAALTGLATIRAFDKSDMFLNQMFGKIDDHTIAEWHLWLINRWFGLRMGLLGAVFALLVAAAVIVGEGMEPSLAGFALGFALQYTEAVIWVMRRYANMELNMNATERIIEYSRMETENLEGADVPAKWPTEGHLSVDNLVVGYAPDLSPVLKGLTFNIEKNQRVGVVGRTGAGKSSLTLALYRFLEAREGSIHIDGIDVSKIKLEDLRSRLAIIPQDPVLFSGTVRSNLDPFDQYSDAELRDALERVHLVRTLSRDEQAAGVGSGEESNVNIFESLTSTISESGLNLSQGQRQLLCLARAIVARPKVMMLDEATSAVDMSTDALIQRSIREEFGDSTLLVIAHRLSTIADFDRILVMSEGRVAEFGSPADLMSQRGEFWKMVDESGEKEQLQKVIMGST